MTEKKKLKQRVRDRMRVTGERYTEALAKMGAETPTPEDVLEEMVERVMEAKDAREVGSVAQAFHEEYFGNTPGWDSLRLHLLEITMPRTMSWATGKESYDLSKRPETAEQDVRDLLDQYRKGGGSTNGKVISRSFKSESGWLGTMSREELVELFTDAPAPEVEFDPEGSPPRQGSMSEAEEAILSAIWTRKGEDLFDELLRKKRQDQQQWELLKKAHEAEVIRLSETKEAHREVKNTRENSFKAHYVDHVVKRQGEMPDESVLRVDREPFCLSDLANLMGIAEQDHRKIAAFVTSARDFGDVRTFPTHAAGLQWVGHDVSYFDVPVYHSPDVKQGQFFAVTDDEKLLVVRSAR